MLEQGHGHLVNTASLAGLLPMGLAPLYITTKFAVVGLSLALRSAAADTGITVHVVCPGSIDAPILGSRPPADLPPVPSEELIGIRDVLDLMAIRAYDPDRLAADVLRGIARNDDLIVAPRSARVLWRLNRYAPWAMKANDRRFRQQIDQLMNRGALAR